MEQPLIPPEQPLIPPEQPLIIPSERPLNPPESLNPPTIVSKSSTSVPLSLINILLSVALLTVAYLIIKDDPDCDKPLVTWTQMLIAMEVGTIAMELLRLKLGNGDVVWWVGYLIGLVGVFLWSYGHFPVYSSEVCNESLWNFVFIVVTVLDGVLGLVVLFICGAMVCGLPLAAFK